MKTAKFQRHEQERTGKMESFVQLDEGRKFQVMLTELQERYAAAHKMRERGLQFVLWLSGIVNSLITGDTISIELQQFKQ